MFGADFCYNIVPKKLDIFDTKTFAESEMEFYVVCTNVETGKAVYHKCLTADDRELTWMRASASLPLAANIVEIYGHKVLDGGLSDSIPLKYFQDIGYKKMLL